MNKERLTKYERDILLLVKREGMSTQREVASKTGYSLGVINQSILKLKENGYLSNTDYITDKAKKELNMYKPAKAIILAAGFGMRMIPINVESPKALLKIRGEVLVERHIRQLKEAGINDIYVVVGFMKEKFEYLIDKYNVQLIVNPDYSSKNNLYSLRRAKDMLDNCYVIPSDIWCEFSPYNKDELYSWYMVSDEFDSDSDVRINRKQELVRADGIVGNKMIGISYISEDISSLVIEKINKMCENEDNYDKFWEEVLYSNNKMIVYPRLVNKEKVKEINTYEQLREIDGESDNLHSEALKVISEVFNIAINQITNIEMLKKGMTNRSFIFSVNNEKYIMRIPGEGTDILINRKYESDVYDVIKGKGLCDDPIYINPENGYKITKFLPNVRACDLNKDTEIDRCMKLLKRFHDMKLKVKHEFDIFYQINFYESLWEGRTSVYGDYATTKVNVFSLREYILKNERKKVLTHIDAIPDNFLFFDRGEGIELQLTDWEYSGMADPDIDLAMFSIYSYYDKNQTDQLIDFYYDGMCNEKTRVKIYCYMSACGLLWSNWCEYKSALGVEFGEYSLKQYRYAKEFYRYAVEAKASIDK